MGAVPSILPSSEEEALAAGWTREQIDQWRQLKQPHVGEPEPKQDPADQEPQEKEGQEKQEEEEASVHIAVPETSSPLPSEEAEEQEDDEAFFTHRSDITTALGNLADERAEVVGACARDSYPRLDRLGAPRPGDWLWSRRESGQTFKSYQSKVKGSMSKPGTGPRRGKNTILLVPIGRSLNSSEVGSLFMPHLLAYCKAFFYGMNVVMASEPISLKGVRRRLNEYDHEQYRIGDMFDRLKDASRNRAGLYCSMGFTLEDIYPNDNYSFVYGRANAQQKTGIFSFARWSPAFDNEGKHASEALPSLTGSDFRSWLQYSAKTMVHEIGHCLGLKHCIYYQCLMNGSNGDDDSAAQSNQCCPVCLRKLLFALSFDEPVQPMERDMALLEVTHAMMNTRPTAKASKCSENEELAQDAAWLEQRIESLNSSSSLGAEAPVQARPRRLTFPQGNRSAAAAQETQLATAPAKVAGIAVPPSLAQT